MALADAVLEIAQDMQDIAESGIDAGKEMLLSYVKQLRRAVTASKGMPLTDSLLLANSPKVQEVKVKMEEGFLGNQLEIADGPLSEGDQTTLVDVPPGGKPGMKMPIGGYVYRLGTDMRLHFDEAETLKLGGKVPPKILLSDR